MKPNGHVKSQLPRGANRDRAMVTVTAKPNFSVFLHPHPLAAQTFQHPSPPFRLQLNQNPQKHYLHPQPFPDTISLDYTKQIHAQILKTQPQINPIPLNSFQFSLSTEARYNLLITSYIKQNHPRHALNIYAHMRKTDSEVDSFSVPSVLKACGQISWVQLGREIHGFALKNGLDSDVFVRNALIQMYSECGSAESARFVFDTMPDRDIVSWSTIIKSLSKYRMFDEALDVIKEMHYALVKPSESAMITMVNLVSDIANTEMSKPMHAYVIKNSYKGHLSVSVSTSLIDMHARCGNLDVALFLFDRLQEKNIVTWTAMIAGCIRSNKLSLGVDLFSDMLTKGILPNEITLLSLMMECGRVGALDLGKQLHVYVLRDGIPFSLALGTALVDMYGKCGQVSLARATFDRLENKDVMTWTAMISAYATQSSCINEAFDLFLQMRKEGIRPNQVTMVSLLTLCAEAGALDLGTWIHAYMEKQGTKIDVVLKTALVDMYGKCGDIECAYRLFREAAYKDICMRNAMMTGLGMHGFGEEALKLFGELEKSGTTKPNEITFIALLYACSHAGLVTEGEKVFHEMTDTYGLIPKLEHYGCMVDLLGRAGLLQQAHDMILTMPMKPNTVVWGALLAACKLHKDTSFAELASKHLVEIDPQNCGYNVLMSNVYAVANRWTEVSKIRSTMKNKRIIKEPGFSTIEVNGVVHEFMMGDHAHPRAENIYSMLAEMMRKLRETGYKPDTSVVLLNIEEKEKETSLTYHSEKIAVAFGLISTAPGAPVRVVKNLRVCDDCHTATKLLSKIYGREIIVRDRNRFHRFREGFCSCGDYW